MKTKYTPGPWGIDDVLNQLDEEYDGQDIIVSKEGCPIATIRGTDDMSCIDDDEELDRIAIEVQANAKLIAAAPELLEMLQFAIDNAGALATWASSWSISQNFPVTPELQKQADQYQKIISAIKKATE